MGNSNRILVIIVAIIAVCAVAFAGAFGVHYAFCNPFGIVIAPDMKTFTIVMGQDMSGSELAAYFRTMKREGLEYMSVNSSVYCTKGEGNYEKLDELMSQRGFTYIGHSPDGPNMRCFQSEDKIQWVRVEYDFYGVWALWNMASVSDFSSLSASDIVTD